MIVKKLGMVSGGGFPGAGYNERKVAEGVARLMAMENVDAAIRHKVKLLHEAGFDCAGEIEKYLKERSRTYGNTKTTRFQFHIAASVKGQVMSADELTDFARQLMAEAGYGRQPYFVYYHHDTDNNHVHILSTRIQPNGFPIPDHFPTPYRRPAPDKKQHRHARRPELACRAQRYTKLRPTGLLLPERSPCRHG